jgi:hypothetical protein
VTGQHPSEVLATSLHLADFTVLKFGGDLVRSSGSSSVFEKKTTCGQHMMREIQFTLFDNFKININDYSTLRQLLIQDKEVGGLVTLSALQELIVYSCHDLSTFLDLRHLIVSKLVLNHSHGCSVESPGSRVKAPASKKRRIEYEVQSTNDEAVELWLQISLKCVENHYCMSWTDFICSMNQVNQWLLCLSSEQSLKECILNNMDNTRSDSQCIISLEQCLNFFELITDNRQVITTRSALTSKMQLLSTNEIFVVQLQIKYSMSEQGSLGGDHYLVCNIHSLNDAVLLTLCFKKLGYTLLSSLIAQHLWETLSLNQETYQEKFHPGIFVKVDKDNDVATVSKSSKNTLKSFAQLKKRLRNLCAVVK